MTTTFIMFHFTLTSCILEGQARVGRGGVMKGDAGHRYRHLQNSRPGP